VFILKVGYHPKTRIFDPCAEGWLPGEKPLFWIGSSKRDLLAMPDPVVRQMGAALSVAQYDGKHPDAKPWKVSGLVSLRW
jgi:phage-related protein